MHSPAFFISILALTASYSTAAPLSARRPTTMPSFWQPNAVAAPIPVNNGPPSSFTGTTGSSAGVSPQDAAIMVEHMMLGEMGMSPNDFAISNSYSSTQGMSHVYATQMFQGLPIANAVSNFNIAPTGAMLSGHQSFVPASIMAKATPVSKRDAPIIPPEQAVLNFAQANGFKVTDKLSSTPKGDGFAISGASFANGPILASQKYYQTADGLVHTWDLNVNMNDNWQNAFVDSASGKVVAVSNWTSDAKKTRKAGKQGTAAGGAAAGGAAAGGAAAGGAAAGGAAAGGAAAGAAGAASNPPPTAPTVPVTPGVIPPATYNVIPMGKTDPVQNNGLTAVTTPWDLNASPNGWHIVGTTQNTDLSGNNVIAQSNPTNLQDPNALAALTRPASANLQFQSQFDATQEPTNAANRDAATTNLFYVSNSVHDIFYNYGFTEAAGNFQISNNGKGGADNDPVIANSQDGSGTNNANFASPPDGQVGIMRMYTFTVSTPNRDGSLENDIITHELAHGLSNRLTGGPANANCLQTLEAGGMGEGWSDAFALITSLPDANTRTTDAISGGYVLNNAKGVRNFPFSTNLATNPLTFNSLTQLNEVHNIGEVWTAIEVLWNMIDISGKTPTAQLVSSAGAKTGNVDLMLLMIAGMKMQPCNPTFIQAKNAIVAAEAAMYNGKYACAIANGFAKRGLGLNAASTGTPGAGQFQNNQDLPAGCTKTF
ncbi:Fungalysin metallopeptidase-domain-containing protein [Obelidium mucronatum]|nr:Fungalysin metallopeptidase-domain-containing protein [Obelidium mucronatum]